ncbi:MAG TPA: hypothetical protein VIY48_13255 [Candidatus Paceibacterota bacterium]
MATFATVTGLARLHLDDIDADVFTDTVLMGYVNAAYREMWQKLAEHGVKRTLATNSSIAVSAGTVETALTLPSRLIAPLQLWEKGASENDDKYIPMKLVTNLSVDAAFASIGEWKWENGEVRLRPVDNNRMVRIRYTAYQPDFALPTDVVTPPLAENFLGYASAAMAARSRDEKDLAHDLLIVAQDSLRSLINDQVRGNQRNLTRARRYGDRSIR